MVYLRKISRPFTIVELLLALSISALLFVSIAHLFYTLFRLHEIKLTARENTEKLVYLQETLSKEIKSAVNVVVSSKTLRFKFADNSQISYQFNGKKGSSLQKKDGKKWENIIDNIISFDFEYKNNLVTYRIEIDDKNGGSNIQSASFYVKTDSKGDPKISDWKIQ